MKSNRFKWRLTITKRNALPCFGDPHNAQLHVWEFAPAAGRDFPIGVVVRTFDGRSEGEQSMRFARRRRHALAGLPPPVPVRTTGSLKVSRGRAIQRHSMEFDLEELIGTGGTLSHRMEGAKAGGVLNSGSNQRPPTKNSSGTKNILRSTAITSFMHWQK